jgi:hypothetical protein
MTAQSENRRAETAQSNPTKLLLVLALLTIPFSSVTAETIRLPALKPKLPQGAASLNPPLSYYEVIRVISPLFPSGDRVSISFSQNATEQDHGGSYIDVIVFQYGLGNPNVPTIGKYKGNNFANPKLCGTLANLHYCSPGEVVTGFYRYFRFTGVQSGNFYGSAYSISSPVKVLSETIYIK